MNLITFGLGGRALLTFGLGNAVRRMGVIYYYTPEEALVSFVDKPWGISAEETKANISFEEKSLSFKEK